MKDLEKEQQRILQMVQEGKLSAQEAVELLEALEQRRGQEEGKATAPSGRKPRWLRIYVKDDEEEVNIKIPWRLVAWALKFSGLGLRLVPSRVREQMAAQGFDADQMKAMMQHLEEAMKEIDGEGLAGEELVNIRGDEEEVRIWLE